jgi:CO/xanthine dehydrogenase FAD-binding subunit
MIAPDPVFFRPETPDEVLAAYHQAQEENLEPLYYAGGTEILSLSRRGRIRPGALIDLKGLAECRALGLDGEDLVFGSAVTLNEAAESGLYPLLAETASAVADHTVRNRLTLGGNITGRLPYREAVLPLLVAEARADICGPGGMRRLPLSEVFDRRLRLEPGEFLVSVRVPRAATKLPFRHFRRERSGRTDYPLLTACLLSAEGRLRLAVSGVATYPLRPAPAEQALNAKGLPPVERARRAVQTLAGEIREDFRASAKYRKFLLELGLVEAVESPEGRSRRAS